MKKILLIWSVLVWMLLPTSSLEAASSRMAIGYNPADFTITGSPMLGAALADMLVTGLIRSRCEDGSGSSYVVTVSEDSRIMKEIEKEIEFSSSSYVDPENQLTYNITKATHMAKGNAVFSGGRVSIEYRIEDRQGNVIAESKMSGPENSFYNLIDEAARSLAAQICKPDPKKDKKAKEKSETQKEQQEVDACTRLWKAYYDCMGDGEKDLQGYARGITCGQHYMPQLEHCNPTAVTLNAMKSEFDDMPDLEELEENFQKFKDMLNGKVANEHNSAQSDAEFEQMAGELEMYTK